MINIEVKASCILYNGDKITQSVVKVWENKQKCVQWMNKIDLKVIKD